MNIGVLKETSSGETRVALVPAHVAPLVKKGHKVLIEKGAGNAAGYADALYEEKGASMVNDGDALIKSANVLLSVRAGAAADDGVALAEKLTDKHIVIGLMEPYAPHAAFDAFQTRKVTAFSMELIPRITRAQSMDVLSSMANLAGYASAIIAANHCPKMFPMMMTAAGTIPPAHVFVLGVGVAGLQAIATAKRLGAVVSAYDVREEVKEQVESLGAKFVVFDLKSASGEGGYAKAMDDAFYAKQRELMKETLATKDVVITTANVPGKKAPTLITEAMVKAMPTGSVIVDLAAERGGNCELTEAGEAVKKHGVTIVGPRNVPAMLVHNASMLYSRNVTSFFDNLWKKDAPGDINWDDDIVQATAVMNRGVVQAGVASWIGGKSS